MNKLILGLGIGLGVGVVCRLATIPLPSPPTLIGALLVLAMTLGYLSADKLFRCRANTTKNLCGGPSGKAASEKPSPPTP
jgi:XapX domain-containing protein